MRNSKVEASLINKRKMKKKIVKPTSFQPELDLAIEASLINKRKIKKQSIKSIYFQPELDLIIDKLIRSNISKIARDTGLSSRNLRYLIEGHSKSIMLSTFEILLKHFEIELK